MEQPGLQPVYDLEEPGGKMRGSTAALALMLYNKNERLCYNYVAAVAVLLACAQQFIQGCP